MVHPHNNAFFLTHAKVRDQTEYLEVKQDSAEKEHFSFAISGHIHVVHTFDVEWRSLVRLRRKKTLSEHKNNHGVWFAKLSSDSASSIKGVWLIYVAVTPVMAPHTLKTCRTAVTNLTFKWCPVC